MPRRRVETQSSSDESDGAASPAPKKANKRRNETTPKKGAHKKRSHEQSDDQPVSPSEKSPPRQKSKTSTPTQGKGQSQLNNQSANQNEHQSDSENEMQHQVIEDLLNIEIPPKPTPIMAADGSGNRLMITQIVSENFKSYFGRHVLGPFHKNFTSIIGPNGSGKSNVIDSLLFVFGFRAQKIRLKKLAQLIHASSNHKDLDFCSVEVHFQKVRDIDDDNFEVVAKSHFMVKRTAYKNGTNNYQLDGKTKQFKDVAMRLRNEGIDLDHNRFLILQGEVEQIALMKPKAAEGSEDGMLEYLEDIIGSSRLKPIINQLHDKVDQLNQLRTSKLNIVKNDLADKQALEPQMRESIGLLKLENQYTRLQHKMLQFSVHKNELELEQVHKEAEEAKEAHLEASKKVEDIKQQKEDRDKTLDHLKKKEADFRKQKEELKNEFDECSKKDSELREDVKLTKKRVEKLQKDVDNDKKKMEELESYPKKAIKEIEQMKQQNESSKPRKEQATKDYEIGQEELMDAVKPLQKEKSTHENQQIGLKKNVNESKAKMELSENELNLQTRNVTGAQKRLDELNKRREDNNLALENKNKTLATGESRLPTTREQFEKVISEIKQLKHEEKTVADKLRMERPRLEEMRSKMSASKNQGKLLGGLMDAVRRKTLTGVRGRLGDLGSIGSKYDVAISSTCGALDCIVTDTTDDATNALDFVKKHSLGQVTFIMLDKQQALIPQMKQKRQFPENVPRLFDLIECEDDVAPAFYFALRDSLIAGDLEQATRIGLGGRDRHRVVTLKGEVVDPSGTMTGGGSVEKRGKIGREGKGNTQTGVSQEQVQNVQGEVTNMEQRLNQVRLRLRELDEDQEKLRRELDQIENVVKRTKQEIKILESELPQLMGNIDAQKKVLKESAPDPQKIKQLQQRVEAAKKEYELAEEACVDVNQAVSQVEEQITKLTDKLTGTAKKILDSIEKEYNENIKLINKANAKMASSERDIGKVGDRLERNENEISSQLEKVEQMRTQLKDMEPIALKLFEEGKIAEKSELEAREEYEQAKQELNDLNPLLEAANSEKTKLKTELSQAKCVVDNKKHQITNAINTMEKLELRDLKDMLSLKNNAANDTTAAIDKVKNIKQSESTRNTQTQLKDQQPTVDAEGNVVNNCDGLEDNRVDISNVEDTVYDSDAEEFDKGTRFEMLDNQQLQQFDWERHNVLLNGIKSKIGNHKPNEGVIADFRKKHAKYLESVQGFESVNNRRDAHRKKYDELRKMRLTEFQTGFVDISCKLKEMYQMITLGGDAELNAVDSMDPFSEGIAFEVRPPKKSWKQITNLSGGEKTLSSLALVFALHYYRPTPLYVMDEIDAALDFRNVSIIGHYLKERTKNAQFVVISLRNQMYELADRLVGIYKTFDCTKHVVLNPKSNPHLLTDKENQNRDREVAVQS